MSEIRVNTITSAEGTSAPTMTYGMQVPTGMGITGAGGVNITGVITATTFSGAFSGAVSGSTGTFSGAVNVDDTTDSTSATTGSLIVDGGLGVAKNVYIGAGLSVAGTLTYEDVTNVDSVGLITAKSGINITAGDYTQTGGGELKVGTGVTIASTSGVSTFSNDVYFNTANGSSIIFDQDQNYLFFGDSVKATFGNSGDLDIYHDGSHSYIEDGGTGHLYIESSQLNLMNAAGSEYMASFVENGSASLFYDNSNKIATTYEGINVSGMMSATAGIAVTGGMWEGAFIKAGKLSDNATIGISTSNIFVFTTQETTTITPNIVWNDSYALSSKMNVGDTVTVTVITTAAAGGYAANWAVDGNGVTEQWNGGSAPSAGGSDGYDVYTLTLVRKAAGTGDTGWLCFANVSNFT